AKIGAEVAKKGERNEIIMKKSLKAKTASHAYALKGWCACTSKDAYAPKALCIYTRQTWAARITELM
ncbi:hypothetical protein PIB30_078365, partial [Stylosanthes scabra]|nr:hypothetical protein [Stylosanthes scabra]